MVLTLVRNVNKTMIQNLNEFKSDSGWSIIITAIYVAKLWNIHWTKMLQNTPSFTELVPEQLGICRESCLESSLDCKTF